MDCHGAGKGWTFNSLLAETLDPACEWVVQDPVDGVHRVSRKRCDAALFVGMHPEAPELGG